MAESINLEPNWTGLRRYVQHVSLIDLAAARRIADEMGSEAPELHETTIHPSPLPSGACYYRISCDCGWKSDDRGGDEGGSYSQKRAKQIADYHRVTNLTSD